MEKERKRAQLSWYLYDFGNSAYAAVVLLAIYSAYFKGIVVGSAEGSRLWGISVGVAMLVSAVVALRLKANGMGALLAEQAGQRAGIISIAVFLGIGLIVLLSVREQHARQAALEYAPAD